MKKEEEEEVEEEEGELLNIRLGDFCFIINTYSCMGLKFSKLKVNE